MSGVAIDASERNGKGTQRDQAPQNLTASADGRTAMLNISRRIKTSVLLPLAFIGIGLSQHAYASCQNAESLFEQKDCQHQGYLNLQSQLDSVHRQFTNEFITQVKENGGDTKAAKVKLAKAHSAWKKFIHADCELGSLLNNGSNAGQNELACEVEHIQQRIKEIKEYQF
jgi:uncharacterized protein YecT (DUF1311 family)